MKHPLQYKQLSYTLNSSQAASFSASVSRGGFGPPCRLFLCICWFIFPFFLFFFGWEHGIGSHACFLVDSFADKNDSDDDFIVFAIFCPCHRSTLTSGATSVVLYAYDQDFVWRCYLVQLVWGVLFGSRRLPAG